MSIEAANKAKAVLDSPAYQDAYKGVREALITRIEQCSLKDTDTAEDLRRCLKLLKDVQLNMLAALNSGKLEQFRLAEEQKRKENPLRNIFR